MFILIIKNLRDINIKYKIIIYDNNDNLLELLIPPFFMPNIKDLTPSQIDAPLFYYERIKSYKKDRIIINFFETLRHNDQVDFLKGEAKLEAIKASFGVVPPKEAKHVFMIIKLMFLMSS